MRQVPANMQAMLASSVNSLAALVAVELTSGQVIRLTTLDVNLTFQGHVYRSDLGCTLSQLRVAVGAASEAGAIETLIDEAGITPRMIERGMLDHAKVTITFVDFLNLSSFVVMFVGYVTSAYCKDNLTAVLDTRSLINRGQTIANEVYSINCRADLGDARCKVGIDARRAFALVTAAGTSQAFVTNNTAANGTWNLGLAVFTSGNNAGMAFEIANSLATGVIMLRGELNDIVSVGDAVTLYPGCDKTAVTCNAKFANIINFRGEPFTVAAWTVTEAAKTVTKVSGKKLYSYLGPINASSTNDKVPHVSWGFPITGSGGVNCEWTCQDDWQFWKGSASTNPNTFYPPIIATKYTKGTFLPEDGYTMEHVDRYIVDWSYERELTDDEYAIVEAAYGAQYPGIFGNG